MSRRAIAIGFGLLAVVSSAQAQDTRLAAVDGSGRILPVASPVAVVQTIGTVRGATPCPKAKAMTPEDARALIGRIAAEERFSPDFTLSVAKNESHFDAIALSEKAQKQLRVQEALNVSSTMDLSPSWVEVDSKKFSGVFKSVPDRGDLPADINEALIVELYSK